MGSISSGSESTGRHGPWPSQSKARFSSTDGKRMPMRFFASDSIGSDELGKRALQTVRPPHRIAAKPRHNKGCNDGTVGSRLGGKVVQLLIEVPSRPVAFTSNRRKESGPRKPQALESGNKK